MTYGFNNAAPIPAADDDGAAALAAIAAWSASGGGDGPEGQFFALHRIAEHGDAAFRADGTPIVVWFGDAPAHDPVCDEISGDTGHDVTEASLTTELTDAGVRVVAISVVTAAGVFPAALDDDPTAFAGDYLATCGSRTAPAARQAGSPTRPTAPTSRASPRLRSRTPSSQGSVPCRCWWSRAPAATLVSRSRSTRRRRP